MADDAGDAAIVRSTVELAHNLGLRVVAEGVEAAEAWDAARPLGCDVAQGFHLSRTAARPRLPGAPHGRPGLAQIARMPTGARAAPGQIGHHVLDADAPRRAQIAPRPQRAREQRQRVRQPAGVVAQPAATRGVPQPRRLAVGDGPAQRAGK